MGLNLNYTADVLVSTEDMQEETWLQYRRNGIGGSDAAAVIGLSPIPVSGNDSGSQPH